jgi:hypothetical protein
MYEEFFAKHPSLMRKTEALKVSDFFSDDSDDFADAIALKGKKRKY